MTGPARVLVLLLLLQAPVQAPPTAAQLLDQVEALLKQVRATVAPVTLITTADELTAALKVGGPILLGPGTYTGNFLVTKPTVLTGAGQALTVLVPKDLTVPPLQGFQVDDVVVQDLTVRNGAPDRETVVFGSATATSAAVQPHRIRLQGIAVVAGAQGGHRGVSLHGTDMTLTDSQVLGFLEVGRQSQGVWICNGPGPYTITGNVIEGSGENLLVGGADVFIVGMNPSDILIEGNTFRKPQAWRAFKATVANLLELKTGVRVKILNNILDGNWKDIQSGNAIVFTVRNQYGRCTWCLVDDVTFRGNEVRNAVDGYAVNILGYDDSLLNGVPVTSQQTKRITIDHNLFADNPMGVQVINSVTEALVITNNTFPKVATKFLQFDYGVGRPKTPTPLTFSRNVTTMGEYGVMGDGSSGPGLPSVIANALVVDWSGNVIEASRVRNIALPAGPGNVLVAPGGLAALLDPTTFKLRSGTAGY